MRLEALQDSPRNFLTSYEAEKSFGMHAYLSLLSQTDVQELVLAAFLNQTPVGILGLYQGKLANIRHKCTFWGTYVQPVYRKCGVGKLLMESALHHAYEKMKCQIIYLSVEATNIPARKLYESCGFKMWGTEPYALSVEEKPYALHQMSLILNN